MADFKIISEEDLKCSLGDGDFYIFSIFPFAKYSFSINCNFMGEKQPAQF